MHKPVHILSYYGQMDELYTPVLFVLREGPLWLYLLNLFCTMNCS